MRVTVINHAKGAAKGEVVLELPEAWRATPASQPVSFSREDEAMTVRFVIDVPPSPMLASAAAKPGGSAFPIKAMVRDEIAETVWPYVEGNRLKPVMDLSFPLEEAAAAHARMEAGDHIGKIVLDVGA